MIRRTALLYLSSLLFLVSSCAQGTDPITVSTPLKTPSPASSTTPTPNPEVLSDCFLSFQVAAWQDLDGNGLWDASEPPLEGVEFSLQGNYAQIWGKPYLSEANGQLTISTWNPGRCIEQDYTITAIPLETYEPTTPASTTFSLATGDFSYEAQFGFRAVSK